MNGANGSVHSVVSMGDVAEMLMYIEKEWEISVKWWAEFHLDPTHGLGVRIRAWGSGRVFDQIPEDGIVPAVYVFGFDPRNLPALLWSLLDQLRRRLDSEKRATLPPPSL